MTRWSCAVAVAVTLLSACEKSAALPDKGSGSAIDPPGIELPRLAAGGVPAPTSAPLLVASRATVTLDGSPVLVLHDGAVAAEDKEGGALGINVPKLGVKLTLPHGPNDPLALAFDRTLTYELLLEVMFSAKQHDPHWDHFALLARSGDRRVAIPLVIPPRARPTPPPDDISGGRGSAPDVVSGGGGSATATATANVALADADGTEVIRDKIETAYMAGIKHCYKQLLRTKPTAQGTLRIGFTLTTKGRVATPTAQGIDPILEACVVDLMKTYRFPVQRDAAGNAIEPAFHINLKMVADSDDHAPPPAPPDPVAPAPDAAAPDPHADPKLFVSVTSTDILVWSITGLEGTLQAPLLKIAKSDPTAMAQLGKTLADVVQRRWGTGARPTPSRQIVYQASSTESIQSVASAMAAMRATADGKELFPDIMLSSGF